MAQSKKTPAKSASKPVVSRKPEKTAEAKKSAAKPAASKGAVPAKSAKSKPVVAKAQASAKPPAKVSAKTQNKTQAKVAVAATPKMKAKTEVTAAQKKTTATKPVATKTAGTKTVAPKTAPPKAIETKAAPAKAAPAAKSPAVAPKTAAQAMLAARVKAPAAPAARAMPAAVHKPAARMMTAPSMPVLPAQPPMPRAAAAPKEVAAKAAEARRQQMLAQPKKPVNQRHGFKIGESIVYPAHGVGQIVGIEEQEIAGMSLELFVIQIEKDKLTLRVPTARLEAAGIRKLAEDNIVARAMETLKGRARIKRTMWSRRAQEYEAKINSGDLIAIAEVVRDLYRSETQPEQSYSERQLYESALDRMAREIAVVDKLDERTAMQRITEVLSRSARGRRTTEESAGDTQAA
jgi:CarD family transcriptional regulator